MVYHTVRRGCRGVLPDGTQMFWRLQQVPHSTLNIDQRVRLEHGRESDVRRLQSGGRLQSYSAVQCTTASPCAEARVSRC